MVDQARTPFAEWVERKSSLRAPRLRVADAGLPAPAFRKSAQAVQLLALFVHPNEEILLAINRLDAWICSPRPLHCIIPRTSREIPGDL